MQHTFKYNAFHVKCYDSGLYLSCQCACPEDIRLSGGIAPRILNLGTRWRWVVSFTTEPLYSWERTPVPIE